MQHQGGLNTVFGLDVKQNVLFYTVSAAAMGYLVLGSCYDKYQHDERIE